MTQTQVEASHYFDPGYDSLERFISYWHQIDQLRSANPARILEVGPGNKFVAGYLQARGYKVATVDIAADLRPNVLGSVLALPFEPSSVDVVGCFEVLEHLPYDAFEVALQELARVTCRTVLLSLPDRTAQYWIDIKIPKLPRVRYVWNWTPRPLARRFDGQHHWEIGWRGYPLSRVIRDIRQSGLDVAGSWRVPDHVYHRFFVLEKRTAMVGRP